MAVVAILGGALDVGNLIVGQRIPTRDGTTDILWKEEIQLEDVEEVERNLSWCVLSRDTELFAFPIYHEQYYLVLSHSIEGEEFPED
jgi:hypothetical protein